MKLFPHQVYGLKQTEGHTNCALYWDMGLGKTFGGSEKMISYGNRVNLVICQKSKVNDWVNHFRDHYPDVVVWNLTNKKEFENFLLFCIEGHTHVAVVNYELAWRRPQLKNITVDFTLMLDESSLIQNRKAKQTKFILALKPKNVILLSGTPTAGKYENLWTQAHLLGWQISEDLYNSQYVNWKTVESDGFFHKIVDMDNPYKNVERLKRKFRDHGAVFLKTEEVFDLPGQTFTTVMVPTSKEYRKFMKTGYVQMTDGTELIGDQVFTKRLYSRQLCGMYSQAKIDAFRDLLASTNDRAIVFYNFTAELVELQAACNDLGRPYSMVNGQVKRLDEYEQYDDSVTLIQYQAGAMGLNLQKANKIIYFTLPERSELFEQSKARIHRIGQNRPCFYWILMCENSVEEMIHQTLLERKDFTDELFIEKGRK
jgi:SNF2 family DNA or RNA helicase